MIFTPVAGTIPLVSHPCPRYGGATYVSAPPRASQEPYETVPGCGCQPGDSKKEGKEGQS
jgi:hypothetical protein